MAKAFFRFLFILPLAVRRSIVRLLVKILWARYVTFDVRGRENIPEGPCLFVSNHLSNADALALDRAFAPRKVWFLAGVKLQTTDMTRLGTEIVQTIPIRPNSPDVEALKRAVETLKQGHSVLIFPEGGRSRTGALIPGKKGAGLIARRAGVPVVPVALTGTEKLLPINDQDMAGERPHPATVTVTIGKPFYVKDLEVEGGEGEDARQLLTDAIMCRVAELLPPEYRGVYAHRVR